MSMRTSWAGISTKDLHYLKFAQLHLFSLQNIYYKYTSQYSWFTMSSQGFMSNSKMKYLSISCSKIITKVVETVPFDLNNCYNVPLSNTFYTVNILFIWVRMMLDTLLHWFFMCFFYWGGLCNLPLFLFSPSTPPHLPRPSLFEGASACSTYIIRSYFLSNRMPAVSICGSILFFSLHKLIIIMLLFPTALKLSLSIV